MYLFIYFSFIFYVVFVQSVQENQRVVVHHPYQHQQVISNTYLGLEYGIEKGIDNTLNDGVEIKFEWSNKDNTSTNQPLQLNIHQGYNSRVIGTQQQHYSYHWKTPSCPFFIRYNPNQYDFSLVFLIGGEKSVIFSPPSSIIRIPLDFTVNNITGLHCNDNSKKLSHHHHNSTLSKSSIK